MKTAFRRLVSTAALGCLAGMQADGRRCLADAAPAGDARPLITAAQTVGDARSIVLPHFESELPPAAGHEAFSAVCVSCHSARYVTMQPPFPRRQWEETVGKMVKVYGAQMSEDQKQAIVGYLVTVNGDGPQPKTGDWSSDDEESAATAGTARAQHPESYPSLKVAAEPADRALEVKRGADLFGQNCAGCHGPEGRGDGFVAPVLWRKPADLTAFRYSLQLLSESLWNGVRGTSMPSWRALPEADLTALAAFVQTLHAPAVPAPPGPETLAHGRTVFLQNCAPCHGPSGDGKSAVAATLSPPPANFHLKQPDFDHVLQVLPGGVPGTAMPAWKGQLSVSDCAAVAGFVRSLYDPAGPERK